MFHTGCRPCEAVGALQSSLNLERKQITLGRSVVHLSNGTTQEREVSKTGRLRVFPLSTALLEILSTMALSNPELPLFPSISGKYINFDNYRRRIWRSALENIGLKWSVYTPYSMRDTFITLALDKGIDVRHVAKLCDNSPDIIYRHYAGWVNEIGAVEL